MQKNGYYISAFLLISLITFWVQCSEDKENTLAHVASFSITTNDFVHRYEKFLLSSGVSDRPSARRQLLNGMIGEILLMQLDDNQEIFNDPEYQAMQERIRRELLLGYYRTEEIDKQIIITDADLRLEFSRVNERLSARHLFVRDEGEAEKLYDQLQNGFTFEQLAPLVFEDDSLANNGGYLGYFTWGDMDPAFEAAAYALKPGEISRPVKTDYGYSIIKVEDRVKHPLLTEDEFARKKNSLRRMVYIRKKKQVEKQVLNDIIKNLDIQIDDQALSDLANLLGIGEIKQKYDEIPVNNSRIVLKYGNSSMTVEEANQALENLAPSNKKRILSPEMLNAALRGLAIQDWLLREAYARGYDQESQFKEKLKLWSGEKFLQFKRRRIFEDIKIPDSLIHNYYLENKDEFIREERINIQEILLTSLNEANNVLALLREGADFGELARKYAQRSPDGILGLLPLSQYGNLKEHFRDASVNKIIGPLKVDSFYLIARVLEREEKRPFQFSEVKTAIEEILKQNKEKENFNAYVDSLRSKYRISVNDSLLMNLKIGLN